jgi:16S rRNA (guanine527-N7)-methyltransferase
LTPSELAPEVQWQLERLLAEARRISLLGPESVARHLEHSLGFSDLVLEALGHSDRSVATPGRVLDLGSGAGLPGLVLAASHPSLPVTLVEGSERRASWLASSVRTLGLDNVSVLGIRAEVLGREPSIRGRCAIVTARSVGRPGVVAEYAAPLLRPGGVLIVSEPPADLKGGSSEELNSQRRWPEDSLAEFGLGSPVRREVRGRRYALLTQERACPDRFPRRVGVPAKQPRF